MARQRHKASTVGDYCAEWWPYSYVAGNPKYAPEKPDYRHVLVKRITDSMPHTDLWYASRGCMQFTYAIVTEDELVTAELTDKNSSPAVRREQANTLNARGYGGPLGSGEARALKRLFTELGKPDLIKRGWAVVETEVWVKPTPRALRRHALWGGNSPAPVPVRRKGSKLQGCYLFKSPLEGVHFSKFIRLARMYRDDSKQLRSAVVALLANPEAAKEIEALDAMDLLAGMKGL